MSIPIVILRLGRRIFFETSQGSVRPAVAPSLGTFLEKMPPKAASGRADAVSQDVMVALSGGERIGALSPTPNGAGSGGSRA